MGSQKKTPLRKTWTWKVGGTVGTDCDSAATAAGAYEMLNGEANMLVKRVQARVVTAPTGATAVKVGDTGDDDGYIATLHAATAGVYPDGAEDTTYIGAYMFTSTAGATNANDPSRSAQEKFLSSATDINLTIAGTASAGHIIFSIDYEILS
jgi:hypothetical protein